MIRLADASLLAATKLRTHKLRTTITILISSLLFAALIAALIIATGITKSMAAFNSQGLNGRYLVLASPVPTLPNGYSLTPEFITYLQAHFQSYIDAKTAEAKKLGIPYDPKTEPSPITIQTVPGQGTVTRPNLGAPEVLALMQQYVSEHPAPSLSDLQRVAAPYHPASISEYAPAGLGGMALMPNGKEVFDPTDDQQKQLDFFDNQASPVVIDESVASPFLLPSVQPARADVPLIVSYHTMEQLLGLKPLSSDASYSQKISRVETLYQKAQHFTVTMCYRNSESSNQIQTAIQQATDLANSKSNKDYVKPNLIYGLPSVTSCAQAPVLSDTRTDAEKQQQTAEDTFNADFGGPTGTAPIQQTVTFQVVGLAPNTNMDASLTFGDLLASVTGSSLQTDIAIPRNLLDGMNDGLAKQLIEGQLGATAPQTTPAGNPYIIQFRSADDARRFIKEQSCDISVEGNSCTNGTGKTFSISDWANNNLALSDLTNKITFVLEIAALAVTVLAIIILTVMIGRTIADGRKETAVFRALGAKRGDIALIYTLYTLYLVIIIAVVAVALGLGAAYAVQVAYHSQATLLAKLLFDAVNTRLSFNFFSVNDLLLLLVVGLIVLAGLLSIVIPLLRNVRRSPIRDMREE